MSELISLRERVAQAELAAGVRLTDRGRVFDVPIADPRDRDLTRARRGGSRLACLHRRLQRDELPAARQRSSRSRNYPRYPCKLEVTARSTRCSLSLNLCGGDA
jgi:hypothetical protein